MKAHFIKLDTVVTKTDTDIETTDGLVDDSTVIINANNISSIRRLNYNDIVQTMILMIGGERFGVHQMPEEIVEMIEHASEYAAA